MSRPADLQHFEKIFAQSDDPWGTRHRRDEVVKRQAILQALGPGPHGRVLELGCGNGSNAVALADRALRLDTTDGALTAVAHTQRVLGAAARLDPARVRTLHLPLPARFPERRYDAIVIAELLYYLADAALDGVCREVARTLRPGGRIVLAHHHRQFDDAAQRQDVIHVRFLRRVRALRGGSASIRVRQIRKTSRWRVDAALFTATTFSPRPGP